MIDRILAVAGVFGWAVIGLEVYKTFWEVDQMLAGLAIMACASTALNCVFGFGKLNG